MGSFSRGYGGYRFDISGFFPRAIKTICLVCIAVFCVQFFANVFFHGAGDGYIVPYLGVSPAGLVHGMIWQLVTYLFLHANFTHILFNLLYLAMFGASLEHTWGAKRFYTYFFICGISAGIVDVLVRSAMVVWWHARPELFAIPTIGCSGAIYGVLLAVAVIMPHRQVWLFPLPVTISMRIFVIAMGAIEFFSTFGASGDGVSHVCHLGGMLAGYIYIRRGSYLYNFRNYFSDWQRRRLRKRFETYVRDHRDKPPDRPDNWVN